MATQSSTGAFAGFTVESLGRLPSRANALPVGCERPFDVVAADVRRTPPRKARLRDEEPGRGAFPLRPHFVGRGFGTRVERVPAHRDGRFLDRRIGSEFAKRFPLRQVGGYFFNERSWNRSSPAASDSWLLPLDPKVFDGVRAQRVSETVLIAAEGNRGEIRNNLERPVQLR